MSNVTTFSPKASCGREELSSTLNVESHSAEVSAFKHDIIKLAMDVHGKSDVVVRQLDNATPQPPQRLTRKQLLEFISRQLKLSRRVVCCYEAGCFGFGLARQIIAMGGECLVIAPKKWDERNKKVRTDNTDAMGMSQDLDRYVGGNCKALAVVHIPTLEQEVARSEVRSRKQFQSDRNSWANRGKSLLSEYGLPAPWRWWQAKHWQETRKTVEQSMGTLAAKVLGMLETIREQVLAAAKTLEELTVEQYKKRKERDKQEKGKRLLGIGELSMSVIQAEIIDWDRFKNRRQVASYTGLCPGASGTGGKVTGLSINKCGNQRLRATLVELAWLLLRYQNGYVGLKRWKAVFAGTNRAAKKKAIVALARRLAVDLWRIHTDRATPEELGLKLAA